MSRSGPQSFRARLAAERRALRSERRVRAVAEAAETFREMDAVEERLGLVPGTVPSPTGNRQTDWKTERENSLRREAEEAVLMGLSRPVRAPRTNSPLSFFDYDIREKDVTRSTISTVGDVTVTTDNESKKGKSSGVSVKGHDLSLRLNSITNFPSSQTARLFRESTQRQPSRQPPSPGSLFETFRSCTTTRRDGESHRRRMTTGSRAKRRRGSGPNFVFSLLEPCLLPRPIPRSAGPLTEISPKEFIRYFHKVDSFGEAGDRSAAIAAFDARLRAEEKAWETAQKEVREKALTDRRQCLVEHEREKMSLKRTTAFEHAVCRGEPHALKSYRRLLVDFSKKEEESTAHEFDRFVRQDVGLSDDVDGGESCTQEVITEEDKEAMEYLDVFETRRRLEEKLKRVKR